MAILVKPYLGCNLNCKYCYEGAYRSKHEITADYDMCKVVAAIETQYSIAQKQIDLSNKQNKLCKPTADIVLHGGEPLCLPKQDVETILRKSFELSGKSGIQTNGTLIDEDHIELFFKYKTNVGISHDGPGNLSAYRMSSKEADRVSQLMFDLKEKGLNISVISVVSKSNAGTFKRQMAYENWISRLYDAGINGRINPCSSEPKYDLDEQTLARVYLSLAKNFVDTGMAWHPFTDMSKRLLGESAVCVFMGCDPFHTDSATVILGDGTITNCMRTNTGDILVRDSQKMNIRDEVLQEIPQDFNGCRGCEFWYACYGGCPMSAIDNDWRNRTIHCLVYKTVFNYYNNIQRSMGMVRRVK